MQRYDTFLRQLVTSADVDSWFDGAEAADQALAGALGLSGLCQGGAVTEKAGTPNISVDVSAPLVAYDASGNRIAVAALTNIPVSVDENAASTTVVAGGNERYLSVFVTFVRSLSDPRLDGNGDTVFYNRAESYTFQVVQAASAPLGTASRPALRPGSILLADIKLINGQTSVLNANIYTNRTQYVHVLTGAPKSVQARTPSAAMQLLEDQINDIINGVVTIAASSVTYAGGAAWLDGLTNPATTAELQLDKIITNLSDVTGVGANGASRIGFAPQGALVATTVEGSLAALDTRVTTVTSTANTSAATLAARAALVGTSVARYLSIQAAAPLNLYAPTWQYLSTYWSSIEDAEFQSLDIPILAADWPHGSTLTNYGAWVKPYAVRAGGERMSCVLIQKSYTGAELPLDTVRWDNGTTSSEQSIGPGGGLSLVANRALYTYIIRITSGGDVAGAGPFDCLYSALVVRTLVDAPQ